MLHSINAKDLLYFWYLANIYQSVGHFMFHINKKSKQLTACATSLWARVKNQRAGTTLIPDLFAKRVHAILVLALGFIWTETVLSINRLNLLVGSLEVINRASWPFAWHWVVIGVWWKHVILNYPRWKWFTPNFFVLTLF